MKSIPLPRSWRKVVRHSMIQVVALAQYAFVCSRAEAASSKSESVRLKAENERLTQEISWLREEIRIKDTRMTAVPANRRPHYSTTDRMAILLLRAARNWSLAQTAATFLVSADTVSSWMKCAAKSGNDGLVALREPVNKFPEFTVEVVRRLKSLCPFLGKVKIAEMLARAGLHLGVTTVGRMLKKTPVKQPEPTESKPEEISASKPKKPKRVTSKRPNDVWLVDLTAVPILSGMWTPWVPNALLQLWPFCWWLAVVMDHRSRKVLKIGLFCKPPTSKQVQRFLHGAIEACGSSPRYLVCDKGPQFWNDRFKSWAKKRSIRLRFGAVGRHGSIAIVERLNWTIKYEWLRGEVVSSRRFKFRKLLDDSLRWHNAYRPHMALGGCTPNEIYHCRSPANRKARIEPRAKWSRRSRCASPKAKVAGKRGAKFDLHVRRFEGRENLPIVTLRRAA